MSLGEFLIVLTLLAAGLAIMAAYLAARNFGWFSLCPQIDDDGERLVAHTGRLPWLLSLTLWYRAVAADRAAGGRDGDGGALAGRGQDLRR